MSLDKNGLLEDRIMSLYRKSLDYLAKTGFDFKEKPSSEWKANLSASGIDKIFDGLKDGANDLPVPYESGGNVLSKTFMEVYGLKKEIDLLRNVRLIRIILRGVSPDNDVSFEKHIKDVQFTLRYYYLGYEEESIIKALHIYEQSLGKRAECHTTLSKNDYISFARILNTKFNLYNSEIKKELVIIFFKDVHKKLMKLLQTDQTRTMLFNRLNYYKITDMKSKEELIPLLNDPKARVELIKKINFWLTKQ